MAPLSVGALRALMVGISRSEPDPLTVRQVAAILAIHEEGGEAMFAGLVDTLGATPASTSRSIDALEARGLAERVKVGRFGVTIVAITPKGRDYVESILDRTKAAA